MTPYTIAKLLRSRKKLEDELASMVGDATILKAASAPKASNRGGSWKQHLNGTMSAIDQIDKMLALDGIKLPKPKPWKNL